MFAAHGFMVYHPQEHALSEQLNFYHDASFIAGIEGTALHNSLFSSRLRNVILLCREDEDRPEAWNGQQRAICRAQSATTHIMRMRHVYRIEGVPVCDGLFYLKPSVCNAVLNEILCDDVQIGPDDEGIYLSLTSIYGELAKRMAAMGRPAESALYGSLERNAGLTRASCFLRHQGEKSLTVDIPGEDETLRSRRLAALTGIDRIIDVKHFLRRAVRWLRRRVLPWA